MDDFLPIIVTSPSGVGKTTLVRRLLSAFSDLTVSVSYTTRAPREGERDGTDYHFVSPETFTAMIRRDAFAEWAEVHGQRYGTSLERIHEARTVHKGMVFVIDHQGARQIKSRIPDAVGVFLLPPSITAMEDRLRRRGTDSDETIARRLAGSRTELQHYAQSDYVIINDDLDVAYDELRAVVVAERARRWRRAAAAEALLRGGSVAS